MNILTKLFGKPKKENEEKWFPKPMSADDYNTHRQDEIDKLESAYDLNSLEGIQSIPISAVKIPINGDSVTGQIEYYLLRFKWHEHEQSNNLELAIECLRKANELMPESIQSYSKDDYLRLTNVLRKYKRYEEADIEEAKIDKMFGNANWDTMIGYNHLDLVLSQAKRYGSDLVEMTCHESACSECAKYQGRWFSLSGRHKKFPKIPDSFFKYGGKIHPGCAHSFMPVFEGISQPAYTKENIVKYSNRPFIDDRSDEEKEYARIAIEKRELDAKRKATRDKNRKEYNWLQRFMPDDCPKSQSAYSRMKSENTETYQILREKAKRLGQDIS